jgi:hypothetical protein
MEINSGSGGGNQCDRDHREVEDAPWVDDEPLSGLLDG